MNRRQVLKVLSSALIWPALASARQGEHVPVVGFLVTHPPADDLVVDLLRQGLREYGYEDGKNIRVEVRTALGQLERIPALAEELVRLPVDVIVVVNEIALRAAMRATRTIPIVMIGYMDDPVALGVIESYRRPGGNVTGIFNVHSALTAKRLEMLKETLPKVSRVAVLWDPAFGKHQIKELQRAAELLRIQLQLIEVLSPEGLESAFKTAKKYNAGAVVLMWSPVIWIYRTRIAAIALEAGMPTISDMQVLAHSGCLLAYGSDAIDNWERGAYYVDRLLKGADAAELPVERLSKLTLVVNLKTAKALGITIPQSILLRADEVIR